MSVQVIGCLSATILYLRFFFYGFEAAVSAPCGRVANAPFLACLSSACSGVWPFRIRCQRASFLCLCRSGGLSATVLYLCFVFTVSKLQFRHRLEGLRTHRFWLRSCSCGTVWTGCERTVRKNHQGSAARAVALYNSHVNPCGPCNFKIIAKCILYVVVFQVTPPLAPS